MSAGAVIAIIAVVSVVGFAGVALGALLGYAIAASVSLDMVVQQAVEEVGNMTQRVITAAGKRDEFEPGIYDLDERGRVRRVVTSDDDEEEI